MTVNLETDRTSFSTRYAPSPPELASIYPRSLAQAARFTDSLELGKAPGLAGPIEFCFGIACARDHVH